MDRVTGAGLDCAACGRSLQAGSRFCSECGAPVTRRCTACGADLADAAKFCSQCGTATTAGTTDHHPGSTHGDRIAERRVTSVLFGDLVGFTALSEGRDAEQVRELLSTYFDQCREVVARYGGTIEKFIGDAVMAVWGVPTTTDSDAERAVRAGLDLIAAVRSFGSEHGVSDLAMRVGVVTGEVAVTLGATGQGMVAGDAVNTASRVQSLAPPNAVWVDEQTHSLTSDVITYRDVGQHTVKGKTRPLTLAQASALSSESAGSVAVDLVGYHREIGLLKNEFAAARASSAGRMLLLVGEPGVGKTRLGHEFEAFIDGLPETVRWHRGRCLAYGDGVAYSALVGAVRGRIGAEEGDDPEQLRDKLRTSLRRWVPDPDEAAWLTPRLEVLLGTSTASFERDELFAAWLMWFERIGADGAPVVWMVDDLHAADDSFLDLLDHLVRSSSVALFVVGLARPELLETRPASATGRRTMTVHLDGLGDAEMAELLDALVGGLDAGTRQRLVERAAGIPLYAIETVRSLLDRGLTEQRDGRLVLLADAAPDDILDPATTAGLQVLISSRLDLLGEQRRTLLQDAAVLGQTFSAPVLASVSGRDLSSVTAVLDALVERDLLTVIRDRLSSEDGQYAFVQSPVRQVAYQMLSRRDRRRRHLAAADALEPTTESAGEVTTVVAQHLTEALLLTDPDDPSYDELRARSDAWQITSAERVRALGALDEALAAYERIIAASDDPAQNVRLHLEASEIAYDVGRHDDVIRHAQAVIDAPDAAPAEVADARTWAAHAARTLGRPQDAEAYLAPYDAAALRELDDGPASRLANARAITLGELGRSTEATPWSEIALQRAEAAGDPRATYLALNNMAIHAFQLETPTLEDALLDACLRLAREHGLRRELVQALVNRSDSLLSVDPKRARDMATEALQLGLASGMTGLTAFAQTNLMLVQYAAGEWDEMLETARGRPAADGVDAPDRLYDFSGVVALQNLVALARGGDPVAPVTWEGMDGTEGQLKQSALMHEGLLACARGDDAGAIDLLTRSTDHGDEITGLGEEAYLSWALAIDRAVATGRIDVARDILGRIDDERARTVRPRLRYERLRLRGSVGAAAGDADPAQVERDLREAVAGLASFGSAPTRARAEAALGRWLTEQGRVDEARPLLEAAADSFASLKAAGWADEYGLSP